MKKSDICISGCEIFFLPVTMRVPLKFGPETVSQVVCLRVRVKVTDRNGKEAWGWGETPMSVSWVWPSNLSVNERAKRMEELAIRLADKLVKWDSYGHPIELGSDFIHGPLADELNHHNATANGASMPYLGSLVVFSAFDIAIHDAFGNLHGIDVYSTYGPEFMNRDLSAYLEPESGCKMEFKGRFPRDFLNVQAATKLPVWHLVGGVDALQLEDLTGNEPQDGHPLLLKDWIRQDGLKCLKVKLRGTDASWDYERMVRVGKIGLEHGVRWFSADFNCTAGETAYVNDIMDRLLAEEPELYARILYVEQPFPYDLEANQLDVRSVSARKPLFLDESAHDWEFVRLGRRLGWSGVALKTCKTQTGALLSLCWAKAHGMPLMVQDLTNPMLAMIPHVRLAAHAGTIQGVECNAMQFYPAASLPEEQIHPGLYRRRDGAVDLSSLRGHGFGYRVDEINRELPAAAAIL
jgi:L-alanine-DL-glutamate epimerase-like enolase superfamily enzyme